MCNRVGLEGEMDFCGESIVVDPNGDVVAKADDTEQILYADIDFKMIREARNNFSCKKTGAIEERKLTVKLYEIPFANRCVYYQRHLTIPKPS